MAGIVGNLANRLFKSPFDDFDAHSPVILKLQPIQSADTSQIGDPTPRDNTLFNSSPRCIQAIFNSSFLLLHFHFRGRSHIDHRNPSCQLRQPLLELLSIVIGSGLLDLGTDLFDPPFYSTG